MLEIFSVIENLLTTKDKIIIGIDGGSCSGKTELARFISSKIDCNVFHLDDFFLTDEQRESGTKGFVNADAFRFRNEVLNKLKTSGSFDYDKYDCKTKTYRKFIVVEQKPVNIVEGTYALCSELVDAYDWKIFLDVDKKTQIERLEKREPDLAPFLEKWLIYEENYFEKERPFEKADFRKKISENI